MFPNTFIFAFLLFTLFFTICLHMLQLSELDHNHRNCQFAVVGEDFSETVWVPFFSYFALSQILSMIKLKIFVWIVAGYCRKDSIILATSYKSSVCDVSKWGCLSAYSFPAFKLPWQCHLWGKCFSPFPGFVAIKLAISLHKIKVVKLSLLDCDF